MSCMLLGPGVPCLPPQQRRKEAEESVRLEKAAEP